MKANEAPYKIYLIRNFSSPTALNTTNDHHGNFLNEWYKSREKQADVEYVRTDVFIEKTCDFIKANIDHYIGHYLNDDDTYLDVSFIEDFKKYMEE